MISEAHIKGIEKRAISPELATSMGLYSARRSRDGSVEADPDGSILCFPFMENGEEINTKYRWVQDGEKRFAQKPNAPKTFFNAEVLMNEDTLMELEVGTYPLIITEGEFDALAAIDCGYPHTVSVPDGASPARDKNGNLIEVPDDAKDLDPATDVKYAFIGRHMERLQRVKTFIIATDGDEPGRRLAKELVRRLGPARCYWIEYPSDEVVPDSKTRLMRAPKDLNEVKMYMGDAKVRELIETAREWPVKGIYKFHDFPDTGEPRTYETGLSPELDQIFRPYPGAFIVVTGIPNMGKSVLAKQIAVELARKHGWPFVMFPGEEPVKPYLHNSLRTAYLRKPRGKWTQEERQRADEFMDRYARIIAHDPRNDEEEIDIDFIIEKAATSVFRDGAKLLIIDPWNELEHKRDRHWSITEYVGDSIRKLKRFARSYDVCVMVVAHPKKIDGCPGLYDISDSAHWANKADLGLVVHTDTPLESTRREVIVPKCRFSAAGRKGIVEMDFDLETELYVPVEGVPA